MQHISTEISSERSRVQNQNMGTNLSRSATLQPINFVTLTRVTNNASCNWVNLVQVSSIQFHCCEQSHCKARVENSSWRTAVQFCPFRLL